jgi:hypothetical protein
MHQSKLHTRALRALGLLLVWLWLTPVVAQEEGQAPPKVEAPVVAPSPEAPDKAEGAEEPAEIPAEVPEAPTPADAEAGAEALTREQALARGDLEALALALQVERRLFDSVEGVGTLREELRQRAARLDTERAATEEQLRWLRQTLTELEAKAEAPAPSAPEAAPEARPKGKARKPKGKAPAKEKGEAAAPEAAPVAAPSPPPALGRGLEERIKELEARLAQIQAEQGFLKEVALFLERKLGELVTQAEASENVRIQEAQEHREEAERQRAQAEQRTEEAASRLSQIQAQEEQQRKELEQAQRERYEQLVSEDLQARSEEIYLLERIAGELPDSLAQSNRAVTEFASSQKSTLERVEALQSDILSRNKPEEARVNALELYRSLARERQEARRVIPALRQTAQRLKLAGASLVADRARLREEVATHRSAATAAPNDQVASKQASVTDARLRRLDAYRTVIDLRSRIINLDLELAYDRLHFAKYTQARLLESLPVSALDEIRALGSHQEPQVRAELGDVWSEVQSLTQRRTQQARSLLEQATSLSGVWWIMRALLMLALLVVAVRRLQAALRDWIKGSTDRLLRTSSLLRTQARRVLKAAELAEELLGPFIVFLWCYLLRFWLFPEDAPIVIGLWTLVLGGFTYVFLNRSIRVLLLPRWFRDKQSQAGETRVIHEEDSPEELQQALFLVATLRLLLWYTVSCQIVLYLVRETFAMFFLGYWIHVLGYLGYAVVIYLLVSRWRKTIASLYERYAGSRSPRSVEFINQHKDRIYGLVVIFAALMYVVVVEGGRRLLRRLEDVEPVRKLRNFLFRQRIELEQRRDKPKAAPTARVAELERLFGDVEHQENPFYLVREAQASLLEALQTNAGGGLRKPLYLVGERGMGKSCALRQVARELGTGGAAPLWWDVPAGLLTVEGLCQGLAEVFGLKLESPTLPALTQALLERSPTTILVDDAQNMFRRRMKGFVAFAAFEQLLVATGRHHQWVASFDLYAWVYLRSCRRKPLKGSGVYLLQPWTDEELQQMIQALMAQTRYTLSWKHLLSEGEELAQTPDGSTAVVQSTAGYYNLLEESARGNPWSAMHYWLSSLQLREDGQTLDVHLFHDRGARLLQEVTQEGRFLLTALLQHTALGVQEVASILNISPNRAMDLLFDLEQARLVQARGERFVLTQASYSDVVRHIKDHNLLHL